MVWLDTHSLPLTPLPVQPIDIAVVPDHTGGLTYPQAVSAPGRTVMRLDFYSPLCDSIGGISQRLGLQSSGQEYSFVCMNDRVSRPLKVSEDHSLFGSRSFRVCVCRTTCLWLSSA